MNVFVISLVACMVIIKERYNLTFSMIISLSLALLTDKCLSKKE